MCIVSPSQSNTTPVLSVEVMWECMCYVNSEPYTCEWAAFFLGVAVSTNSWAALVCSGPAAKSCRMSIVASGSDLGRQLSQ